MKLREKKRNVHIQNWDHSYQPVIGVLNPITSLNCRIEFQKQQHKFDFNFQHPLSAITRLTQKCMKNAFQKIVEATFEIRIEQKTTFIPQALLTGKHDIIHEYKMMLQKGRIGSYIPLNIKHNQKSLQRKRPVSCNVNQRKQGYQLSRSSKLQKVLNEKTVNERTIKKTYNNSNETINMMNYTKSIKNLEDNDNRSLKQSVSKKSNIVSSKLINTNESNHNHDFNYNINVDQHHHIRNIHHHTHIVKKAKSKSNKKSSLIDGIKINYIQIKSNNENPETSTFVYKSSATKTMRNPSQYGGGKTDISNNNFNNFNKTFDLNKNNQLSFSIHQDDKISVKSNVHKNQHDNDSYSQNFEKQSLKNYEMSQLTHNQLYTKNYIYNDRKILKKGRKAVHVENFERKQIH